METNGTIVSFSSADVTTAMSIANARAKAGAVNEAEGVRNGTYDALEIELVGIMGEMAAAHFYGVDAPCLEVRSKRSSKEPDIVVGGWGANIKATKYSRNAKPSLLVKESDTKQDAYILVSVNTQEGTCDLLGFVTRDQLLQKKPVAFRSRRPLCRVVRFVELRECRSV